MHTKRRLKGPAQAESYIDALLAGRISDFNADAVVKDRPSEVGNPLAAGRSVGEFTNPQGVTVIVRAKRGESDAAAMQRVRSRHFRKGKS